MTATVIRLQRQGEPEAATRLADDPFDEVDFTKAGRKGGPGRYWLPCGTPADQLAAGVGRALQLIGWLEEKAAPQNSMPVLPDIVRGMVKAGRWGQLEIGFMDCLEMYLTKRPILLPGGFVAVKEEGKRP